MFELTTALFLHSPMPIGIARLVDGCLVEFNWAFERALAHERDQILGKSFVELGFWQEPAGYQRLVDQVTGGKRVVDLPIAFRSKDGNLRQMQMSAHMITVGADSYLAAILAPTHSIAKLENELREREGLLNLFLDHAPAALAMFDTEMRYLLASRRWRQAFALGDDDLTGRSQYDVFPEIPEECKAENRRVVAGEVVQVDEWPFRRADGSVQLLKLEERPWYTAGGGIGGMVIFAEDITEQKKAEQDLAQSEATYRAVVETCQDGFWMIGEGSRIIAVNDAYVRLSGYSREELIGMHPWDLEDGNRADEVRQHIEQMKTDGTAHFSTWHRTKDGRRWTVEVIVSEWPSPNGRGFVFSRDVSEHQRAWLELKESEARFRDTFEQAAVGMAHIALDGKWLRVNRKMHGMLGYSAVELAPMTAQEITHPDDRDDAVAQFRRLRSGEAATCSFEKRYLRKGGGIFWAHVTTTLARDAFGAPLYYISVGEDITERRQMEAQLAALRGALENMTRFDVAGHTVAALAHELNQPLSAVSAFAEAAVSLLAAGNRQPDKLRHALQKCAQESQRAGRVVHNLLAFLRHGEAQRKALNLKDLVRQVVSQIKANGHDDVRFDLHLPGDLPAVEANRLQIQMVLTNLVDNGIESMQSAGCADAAVTVSLTARPDDQMAQVTVSDAGPGIEAEILRRVFDTFFTTKPDGLGIGLAICRTIIESHGGRLWADSEPGAGAHFHFTLPFAQ